jgi:isoleucyl-tRNA synthetase
VRHSLRWRALLLVFLFNSAVFAALGVVLARSHAETSRRTEELWTEDLVATIQNTIAPEGLLVASILRWPSWRFIADAVLVEMLQGSGALLRSERLVHAYPFCYRTDTPLIYKAIPTWFVAVETYRDRMAELNERIRWVPEAVGAKRFGNWLREARDWAVSRNRYWGSCIPVWVCASGHRVCIGSRAELQDRSGVWLDDLHRDVVDPVTFPCPECAQTMRRVPEVLDCWFESGAMPYGQKHYPFENKELFDATFPADFIAEALDQTRAWFYYLLVLSTALFDKPGFKNVIVNGLVLAEDGRKMSKSKKNYPEPEAVLAEFGADALRAYLIDSPVVRAEPQRFSERGLLLRRQQPLASRRVVKPQCPAVSLQV